jgi:hypothetical protein
MSSRGDWKQWKRRSRPAHGPTLKASRICPRCGRELVLKNGRRGTFYGCVSFPACRYTAGLHEYHRIEDDLLRRKREGTFVPSDDAMWLDLLD